MADKVINQILHLIRMAFRDQVLFEFMEMLSLGQSVILPFLAQVWEHSAQYLHTGTFIGVQPSEISV